MQRFAAIVTIVIVGAILMLTYGVNKYGRYDLSSTRDSDIAYRYRLVCGAYPDLALDLARIPNELHSLVPLAQRYGHGNQILRDDCIAKMGDVEAKKLASLVDSKQAMLNTWLEKFPKNFPAEEVVAFRELITIRAALRPARASDRAG